MIFGVGIDLVEIERIKNSIDNFGDRFLNRTYTQNEQNQALTRKNDAVFAFYATRFAAKEAFAKATGYGIAQGISFNEIEIYNNNLGCPKILLLNKTKQIVDGLIKTDYKIHLSLSDTKNLAIATAQIEKI